MNLKTLKQLLEHYGLSPNKTYGQNFLMDDMVLHRMAEVAEVTAEDFVVEVGPGIGNLTRVLLEQAGQVVSIEKDDQFLSVLREYKSEHDNFDYVLSDVLEVDITKVVGVDEYKVVANIPYYVTGKIIQHFIQTQLRPQSMTLLMQKEVAQNMTAAAGKLNLLALSVQLYADVRLVEVVQSHKFYPEPKVDSAVVHITFSKNPKYNLPVSEQKLFQLLRACFAGKRKQIHNTLQNNLGLTKEQVETVLSKAGLEDSLRPQQLTIEQWLELAKQIDAL